VEQGIAVARGSPYTACATTALDCRLAEPVREEFSMNKRFRFFMVYVVICLFLTLFLSAHLLGIQAMLAAMAGIIFGFCFGLLCAVEWLRRNPEFLANFLAKFAAAQKAAAEKVAAN
jgi:hypothetical protein